MYLRYYLTNLADILAVYYIVYRLILLLKGTRAMQVIWGVFVLAVVTSLAKYFNLAATVWLMQQFWLAGIFMLIVVFQPEIRFALANIGSNPLGRMMVSQEYRFIGEMMEAVRAAVADTLIDLGYHVTRAENAEAALKLLEEGTTVDLLFTDVVMSQLNGKELSERVEGLHPETRILFTSAYAENAIVHQEVLSPSVAILQKPFTPSALAHKVREVLDQ